MSRSDPHGTNKITNHLMEWARRPGWAELLTKVLDEHTADVMAEFDIESLEALAKRIDVDVFSRHCFACAFEDLLGRENNEGETIVDEYLRRRSYREAGPAKRYLRGLGDSIISLYEVVESVPGSHLILRDRLRGGEPFRVEERAGSKQLVKWDLLATRVVSHTNGLVLSGGMQRFEPETADALERELRGRADAGIDMAEIERDFATRGLTLPDPNDLEKADPELLRTLSLDLVLADSAPTFSYHWLTQTLRQLSAPPPKIVNTDGDEIVFFEISWQIIGDPERVMRGLGQAESESLVRMDSDEWGWLSARHEGSAGNSALSGAPDAASRRRTIAFHSAPVGDPLNRISLGTIALEGNTLVLDTNSEKRAERGRAMIEGWLNGLLGRSNITRHELGDIRNASATTIEEVEPEPSDPIPPDEQAEIIGEMLERHYRSWIDTPLPILDGQSPRQLSKTPDGRVKLVRLVKDLENHAARQARGSGIPLHDFGWLWRELGIAPNSE